MAISTGLIFLGLLATVGFCDVLIPDVYKDCGSTGKVEELNVTPCPSIPCQLQRKTNSSVGIKFTMTEPSEKLEVLVYGAIGPVDIQFGGIDQNACLAVLDVATNKTACPITDITVPYTFRSNVEVLSVYPLFELGIKFKIVNPAKPDVNIVCVQFPAKIVAEADHKPIEF